MRTFMCIQSITGYAVCLTILCSRNESKCNKLSWADCKRRPHWWKIYVILKLAEFATLIASGLSNLPTFRHCQADPVSIQWSVWLGDNDWDFEAGSVHQLIHGGRVAEIPIWRQKIFLAYYWSFPVILKIGICRNSGWWYLEDPFRWDLRFDS